MKGERGQVVVLTAVMLASILGLGAMVLDVGAWFRAKRQVQATADAAALAGAQALHLDAGQAQALAVQYGTSNDTVTVNVKRTAPGFFAKIFGVKSVSVGATATARSEPVSQAFGVAPITVHYKQPLLHCTGGGNNIRCNPEFGPTHPTTLTLDDLHSSGGGNGAGAFGLINLDQTNNNPGANVLADWLLHGFNGYLPLGQYNSAPGADFNNSQFLSALQTMLGQQLLFPVYRVLKGPGSNALYDIIAWVGFVPTSYDASGSNGTITGYFTTYIADGVQVTSCGCADLGVHKVELVN